jgi:hypothetical protein
MLLQTPLRHSHPELHAAPLAFFAAHVVPEQYEPESQWAVSHAPPLQLAKHVDCVPEMLPLHR